MTENQLLALTRQYGSMDEALKNMPQAELRLNDNSVYDKKGTIESISGVIDRQTGTGSGTCWYFPNEIAPAPQWGVGHGGGAYHL